MPIPEGQKYLYGDRHKSGTQLVRRIKIVDRTKTFLFLSEDVWFIERRTSRIRISQFCSQTNWRSRVLHLTRLAALEKLRRDAKRDVAYQERRLLKEVARKRKIDSAIAKLTSGRSTKTRKSTK